MMASHGAQLVLNLDSMNETQVFLADRSAIQIRSNFLREPPLGEIRIHTSGVLPHSVAVGLPSIV